HRLGPRAVYVRRRRLLRPRRCAARRVPSPADRGLVVGEAAAPGAGRRGCGAGAVDRRRRHRGVHAAPRPDGPLYRAGRGRRTSADGAPAEDAHHGTGQRPRRPRYAATGLHALTARAGSASCYGIRLLIRTPVRPRAACTSSPHPPVTRPFAAAFPRLLSSRWTSPAAVL